MSFINSQGADVRGKKSFLFIAGAFALVALVTLGVFAKNGWFPSTDPFTGKKTGWFGKELAKNASSSWNPLAAPLWNMNCNGGGCDVGKATGYFGLTALDLSGVGTALRGLSLARPVVQETGEMFAIEVLEETADNIGQTLIRNAADDIAETSVNLNNNAAKGDLRFTRFELTVL